MTLFFLEIDPQGHRLQWVRAGHPPALLYDPAMDRFRELKGHGPALGVHDSYAYRMNPVGDLHKGQVIAIGTDGIWEATNHQGEFYGMQRYRQLIRQNARQPAETIVGAIYEDLRLFSKGIRQKDDITLVIIKVSAGSEAVDDWQI
jgi:sigma-B regulation protein RsbU (phosphoserine phosphatase)